jgi:hypothetical protein
MLNTKVKMLAVLAGTFAALLLKICQNLGMNRLADILQTVHQKLGLKMAAVLPFLVPNAILLAWLGLLA